jgi:hypothetical protein
MDEITPRDRARLDAQADVEAWEYALSILRPWMEAAVAIGSPEVEAAMDLAEGHALGEYYRAQDKLEAER